MFYELNEDELEKVKEIQKITGTDYNIKGNYISIHYLMFIIKDLLYLYNEKKYEEE